MNKYKQKVLHRDGVRKKIKLVKIAGTLAGRSAVKATTRKIFKVI